MPDFSTTTAYGADVEAEVLRMWRNKKSLSDLTDEEPFTYHFSQLEGYDSNGVRLPRRMRH